jgi:hypothetical protein
MTTIKKRSTISMTEWETACKACENATFFHTPFWYRLAAEYYGKNCRPEAEKFVFKDTTSAVMMRLKVPVLHGLFTAYESSPFGTYGGWIAERTLADSSVIQLIKKARRPGTVMWRENPFDPQLTNHTISGARDDFTNALDLSKGIDRLLGATSHGHRYRMRRAEREGIRIAKAESMEQWKEYFATYQDSLDRWKRGGPETMPRVFYSWKMFELIFTKITQRTLWIAVKDSQILGGIICFYWNKHVAVWHGSSLEAFFNSGMNNLLYWEAVNDAVSKRLRWFDCNPSGGYKGVEQFKENLGTFDLRSRVFQRTSPILSAFRKIAGVYRR